MTSQNLSNIYNMSGRSVQVYAAGSLPAGRSGCKMFCLGFKNGPRPKAEGLNGK